MVDSGAKEALGNERNGCCEWPKKFGEMLLLGKGSWTKRRKALGRVTNS